MSQAPIDQQNEKSYNNDSELREFMLVLRQALLMVTAWIERKYQLKKK